MDAYCSAGFLLVVAFIQGYWCRLTLLVVPDSIRQYSILFNSIGQLSDSRHCAPPQRGILSHYIVWVTNSCHKDMAAVWHSDNIMSICHEIHTPPTGGSRTLAVLFFSQFFSAKSQICSSANFLGQGLIGVKCTQGDMCFPWLSNRVLFKIFERFEETRPVSDNVIHSQGSEFLNQLLYQFLRMWHMLSFVKA